MPSVRRFLPPAHLKNDRRTHFEETEPMDRPVCVQPSSFRHTEPDALHCYRQRGDVHFDAVRRVGGPELFEI